MKRLLVTALWVFDLWYLGSIIAFFLGIPDLLGPILGLSAGVLVTLDPRRVYWNRTVGPVAPSPGSA